MLAVNSSLRRSFVCALVMLTIGVGFCSASSGSSGDASRLARPSAIVVERPSHRIVCGNDPVNRVDPWGLSAFGDLLWGLLGGEGGYEPTPKPGAPGAWWDTPGGLEVGPILSPAPGDGSTPAPQPMTTGGKVVVGTAVAITAPFHPAVAIVSTIIFFALIPGDEIAPMTPEEEEEADTIAGMVLPGVGPAGFGAFGGGTTAGVEATAIAAAEARLLTARTAMRNAKTVQQLETATAEANAAAVELAGLRGGQSVGTSAADPCLKGMAITRGVGGALDRLAASSGVPRHVLGGRFHRIKAHGNSPGPRDTNFIDDVTGDVYDSDAAGNVGQFIGNVFNAF